jgi:Zn-finger nucleic acid-binding protein
MNLRAGTRESSLELKYCERCGGLWLRPTGGEQIYCTVCARAMAELPPSSAEVRHRRSLSKMQRRAKREMEACVRAGVEPGAGGVA